MDGTSAKSSESVRNGISLSGEKDHQKKHQHRRSKRECEKDVEGLKKELANCKLQLEAKHAAHMQALRKVERYQRLNSELFNLLKKSDSHRKKHMNEGNERGSGTGELESMMKQLDDQLGNPNLREQISHLLSELKTRERMLLNKEMELLAAKDSELKAQTKIEEMEAAFNIEKEEKQQIIQQLEVLKVEKQREDHSHYEGQREKHGEAAEESNSENMTTPLKEYENLIREVRQANEATESVTGGGSLSETAILKMELEAATAEIKELRARAEQALIKAELAEKAKADFECKLRRHRERKQRRKAAMAALEEESTPSQFTPSGVTPQAYESLNKILNLKL